MTLWLPWKQGLGVGVGNLLDLSLHWVWWSGVLSACLLPGSPPPHPSPLTRKGHSRGQDAGWAQRGVSLRIPRERAESSGPRSPPQPG